MVSQGPEAFLNTWSAVTVDFFIDIYPESTGSHVRESGYKEVYGPDTFSVRFKEVLKGHHW